jgi:hypothetical protein
MKLSELIDKYIEIRDKKAQLKAEYDLKKNKMDDALDKIEAVILKTFDASGMDSAKTENGTAYTSRLVTATVADPDIFMQHIIATEAWHMIEKRCSKVGVEQYRAEHDEVPPGINWREERVVNVRRSS